MNAKIEKSQGLTCPNCKGVVPVPEGVRMVRCPYCDQQSLVQGERGVRRWQVARNVEREQALKIVQNFFSDIKKANGLKRQAKIREVFLVYLPYWRVAAFVAGWMFGRIRKDKDSTRPSEVEVMEEMHWNDAAVDVAEFGVHSVQISKDKLIPFDSVALHREAMVFEPTESRTEALAEAEQHFVHRGQNRGNLVQKHFEKFHTLRPNLSLVYYPLWVARYEFRERNYQVVIDGVKGKILYGKAPGNIFYRAAALVVSMALGNLILVNGTILALTLTNNSSDDDGSGFFFVPALIGLGLTVLGYHAFRYGEEVEEVDKSARKAITKGSKKSKHFLETGLSIVEELAELK